MQFEENKVSLKESESQESLSGGDQRSSLEDSEVEKPELGEGYSVLSLIGRGGMASVYKIYDKALGKTFAAKVMNPEKAAEPVALKRFADEVEAAASMTHGNIAAVYSHGVTAGNVPFLFMDYLEGETLSEILQREEKIEPIRALGLFQQICEALIHAHMKGVVHRDLKPGNIFISKNEEGTEVVKLVDFGIAKLQYRDDDSTKLTQTGALIGSPFYMSPEQCRGESQDARSDIYSLGCVMFHALTGKPPFEGANSVKIILQHVKQPAPPMAIGGQTSEEINSLEACVRRCLEKDPAQRYQSADQLLAELHSLNSKQPNLAIAVEARPAPFRRVASSLVDGIVLFFLIQVLGHVFVHAAFEGGELHLQSVPSWQAASLLAYCQSMAPWLWLSIPLFILSSLLIPPVFVALLLLGNSPGFYGSWGGCFLIPLSPLIFFVYSALFESSPLQGTLGKSLLGLRVVSADGKRIGPGHSIVRSLLKWFSPFIIFASLAVRPICRDFKLPFRNFLSTFWQTAKFFPPDDAAKAYVVRKDSRSAVVNRQHYDPSPNLAMLSMMRKRWISLQFLCLVSVAISVNYLIAPGFLIVTVPMIVGFACIPYVEIWRRIRNERAILTARAKKEESISMEKNL
ncbi:MAG: protein kinase [Candidatus Obscuribacterales bacterium]|nr:protein kinase [Candidatus Obscuribacterales bacterium]